MQGAISDLDLRAAMEFSRSINANPRQASVTPILKRELPPRAAKRARTSGSFIPITPQSMPPTPPQAADLDPASSPLSSPPSSERSFKFGESSMSDQPETPVPVRKRTQQGIPETTIAEGDPSRGPKNKIQTSDTATPEAVDNTTGYPLIHNHVGQHRDGSWSSEPQGISKAVYAIFDKPSRRHRSTTTTRPRYSITDDDTEPESEHSKTHKSRVMKRKAHDDDFSEIHDTDDHPDSFISPPKATKKSKSTGKGKANNRTVPATRRVPVAVYHANNQRNKPEPHGNPEVWADKRQQLCETLPYFIAYQSGAYTNSGIVYGHLIDAEVDARDKFDEQIVITSVGGGRSKDEDGKSVRTVNQVKSTVAASFMRTKDHKLPVAIIAGQGNRISPSRLPHYYNVLGWFHVTDVWAEKSNGFITWRVRLEKICLTQKSWWAVKGSPVLTHQGVQNVESQICSQCHQSNKLIYNAGWACLNTGCISYFQFANDYDDATLDYNETFLRERTEFQGTVPGPLSPPLLTDQDMVNMEAFGVETAFKRGIVCPRCGCCSRRVVWGHWLCENEICDFTYQLKQKPMSITDVLAQSLNMEDDHTDFSESKPDNFVAADIRSSQTIYGHWDVNQYTIPGETGEVIGFVRHFKANSIINQQKDGPNDLFMQMQAGDFNLRRSPARQGGSTGEILTSHWAANWGAPYKYGVRQLSKGFDEAPQVILKAIKRLTWAGEHAVTGEFESFEPFNECLSIGYFENTKIGYHDDGEKELGPTVATLSLGAKAEMSFRPKAKCSIGKKARSKKGDKPAVLRLALEHGDIMVMHGRQIQKFYEHAVTPKGPLRYALTCRYVRPEMMANQTETQDAILKGTLPPGCEQYDYDGDINATCVIRTASEVDKFFNNLTAGMQTGALTDSDVREIDERLHKILRPNTEAGRAIESSADVLMLDVA